MARLLGWPDACRNAGGAYGWAPEPDPRWVTSRPVAAWWRASRPGGGGPPAAGEQRIRADQHEAGLRRSGDGDVHDAAAALPGGSATRSVTDDPAGMATETSPRSPTAHGPARAGGKPRGLAEKRLTEPDQCDMLVSAGADRDRGGEVSIVEHPRTAGAITAQHEQTGEAAHRAVPEGEIGFRSDDSEFVLGPGGQVTRPRDQLPSCGPPAAGVAGSSRGFETCRQGLSELNLCPEAGSAGPIRHTPARVHRDRRRVRPDLRETEWLDDIAARYGLALVHPLRHGPIEVRVTTRPWPG